MKIIVYLDNSIGAAKGCSGALKASTYVRGTLREAGFIEHPEKCCWNPSTTARWLGFELDLKEGIVTVPLDKITALKVKIESVAKAKSVSVRDLASITGTVISMGLGIGPVSRLMTRALYTIIESRQSWSERIVLNDDARKEIDFWSSNLQDYNSQPIWHSPSAVRVVYSDASDTGYGGYTVEHGPVIVHGQWTPRRNKTKFYFS